jgi:DNA-binding transcriptional LysR family regulator
MSFPAFTPALPDLDQLRGLRAFVAAAQSLSFTRAAVELDVSPQAVSGAVARLEGILGVRLFNRSTRSMALTDEGARFYPQAADALARLRDAVHSAAAGDAPTGLVRISVAGGFARRYVLPELPGLRAALPQVQLELALDDRKVDMVREGFDIVIRGGVLGDANVVSRPICALSTVLVASPDYLARRGVPRLPQDLLAHDLISLRFLSGLMNEWRFERAGQDGGKAEQLEPRGVLTLSDPYAVSEAAALGLGIGSVAVHHALPLLRTGQLKTVLLDSYQPMRREMALQYPHREHLAPRVKAVVSYLLERFESNVDLHLGAADLQAFAA